MADASLNLLRGSEQLGNAIADHSSGFAHACKLGTVRVSLIASAPMLPVLQPVSNAHTSLPADTAMNDQEDSIKGASEIIRKAKQYADVASVRNGQGCPLWASWSHVAGLPCQG